MRQLFQTICIGCATLVSGCALLPQAATERVDERRVEYAMTTHDTIPVIFENGLGGSLKVWEKVLPEISKDTTTFVYNRPGYGDSEAVSTPRDGAHVVDELRSLLLSKGLKPPYALVGHSLGGLYMQYFARRYPDEVAALILVDSTHPSQMKGKGTRENWPFWYRWMFAIAASKVVKQEFDGIESTGEAVLALPSFTGKPVIILSASQQLNDKSEQAVEANKNRNDFVRLYPGARQIWVNSGHLIPREKPDSVISAIREVLASIPNKDATNVK
jgi:pimeloyl-ACP methyl ester carboxylesterase